MLTPLNLLFLKSTFFILYLQLFEHFPGFKRCSVIGLVFTIITYTTLTVASLALDIPSQDESWIEHRPSPGMRTFAKILIPQSAIGLLIDVYILLIPVVAVSRSTMSLRKKVDALFVFFSGAL